MSAQKEQKQKQQISYFEKQRDVLISEIAISMDSVLNNINALNRSLEGSIAVGKEFDSVSSLWSNFYDDLAQVEQLRGGQQDQSEEESGGKEQPEEQPDQEMRSDSPVNEQLESGEAVDKIAVEHDSLSENVELHDEPKKD